MPVLALWSTHRVPSWAPLLLPLVFAILPVVQVTPLSEELRSSGLHSPYESALSSSWELLPWAYILEGKPWEHGVWDAGGTHAVREKRVPRSSQQGRALSVLLLSQGCPGHRAQYTQHILVKGKQGGRQEGRKDRWEGEKEEKGVPGGHCFAHNSHKGGGENPVILHIHMFTVQSYIIMEYLSWNFPFPSKWCHQYLSMLTGRDTYHLRKPCIPESALISLWPVLGWYLLVSPRRRWSAPLLSEALSNPHSFLAFFGHLLLSPAGLEVDMVLFVTIATPGHPTAFCFLTLCFLIYLPVFTGSRVVLSSSRKPCHSRTQTQWRAETKGTWENRLRTPGVRVWVICLSPRANYWCARGQFQAQDTINSQQPTATWLLSIKVGRNQCFLQ